MGSAINEIQKIQVEPSSIHPPSFVSILPRWVWTSRPFNSLCFFETRCCHLRLMISGHQPALMIEILAHGRQTTLMIYIDKVAGDTWSSKETWSWTATPSFTPHHPRTSAWDRSNPAWLSWVRLFSTAGTGAKPVALTNLQPAIQTYGHRGEKKRMKALTYINQYKAENVKQCNGENPFVGPSVHISTEETTSVGQMEFSAKDTWINTPSLAKLQVCSLSRHRK